MTRASILRTATAIAALMVASVSAEAWPWSETKAPPPPPAPIYNDTAQPFDKRVDDLISRMTLEEKASQLVNQARPIPRLGVHGYNWWGEALHGVARNGTATVFPQAIALGATFDPALIHEMATAISTEARVKFNQAGGNGVDHAIYQGLSFWSPNVNIFRDPRWGRGQETYGEDPWLTGQFAKAFVTGMQGDDAKYMRTIATPKHFAVHSGPEPTRHTADVAATKHDMADTYLPQFRAAVVEGHAGSVMCAYNRINGQPGCANDFLLTETLRKAWGFNGYMVSDCDAIEDITYGHHYTKNIAEAAAVSLKHGVDNDCADYWLHKRVEPDYSRYIDAMKQGLVSEAVVDESLKRLFMAQMRLGLFDPKEAVAYTQIPDSALDSPAHRQVALRTAREAMVLLKNNGALPLKHNIKRIAVIGPLADQVVPLFGNYNGIPTHAISALDGLKKAFPNAEVVFESGTNFLRESVAVPPEVLSADGKPGLTAEYFDNEAFSGKPVITRRDAKVDFGDENELIKASKGTDIFALAMRWSGTLTPAETGDYLLGLDAPGGMLFLDGKQIAHVAGPGGHSTKATVVHLDAGHPYAVRIERGFTNHVAMRLTWLRQDPAMLKRAMAAVKKADAVVAVVGITPGLEGEEMAVDVPGFVGGDRTSLDLPKAEEDLLKAARKATKKPLITVLYNGSALSVNWAAKNADAILEAWYGGQEAGTAIADILSGAYNPSGRLPVTFYAGVKDLPPFDDYTMANRTYRYYTGKPLYPFGYGLSYTSFGYNGLKLSAASLKAGEALGVDVEVKNTGKVAGDEVAQLYLSFPGTPGMPVKALRGLQRVSLQPGEAKLVHFDLKPRDLSSVTQAGEIKVQPGAYTLSVGSGQPGTTKAVASAPLAIEGEQTLPQ
ncbi:MAG: glycoside hydrolase family 3 C-terminal domain-containing protein [Rhizomicrobium sp.]|nr:glycoside hydrolase family 3 C-terminal domain-containing protein [Rhizomicrobium sp.]